MSSLGTGVLYLVLVALELLAPGPNLDVDYLQDGLPVATLEVRELPDSDRDLYLVRAQFVTPDLESTDPAIYRIEQSDLVSTNYLLYAPDSTVPVVVSLVPALDAFPPVVPSGDYELNLDFALAGEAAAEVDSGALLVVLPREPYLIISAPESGAILLVDTDL